MSKPSSEETLSSFYTVLCTSRISLRFYNNLGAATVTDIGDFMRNDPKPDDVFHRYGMHFCMGTNLDYVLGIARMMIKKPFQISTDPLKNYLAVAHMIVCNEDPSCKEILREHARGAIAVAKEYIKNNPNWSDYTFIKPILRIADDIDVLDD